MRGKEEEKTRKKTSDTIRDHSPPLPFCGSHGHARLLFSPSITRKPPRLLLPASTLNSAANPHYPEGSRQNVKKKKRRRKKRRKPNLATVSSNAFCYVRVGKENQAKQGAFWLAVSELRARNPHAPQRKTKSPCPFGPMACEPFSIHHVLWATMCCLISIVEHHRPGPATPWSWMLEHR